MLRITVASLLLGALALSASLILFFPPPGATGQQAPPVTMSTNSAKVLAGTGTLSDGEILLELNAAGMGIINMAGIQIEASRYPFLHLQVEGFSSDPKVAIAWNRGDTGQKSYFSPVGSHAHGSSWLATNELLDWTGSIGSLNLVVVGQAGEVVRVSDFSLFPASPTRQLRALYSDLTRYVPWNRAAMNTHTGVTQVSSFYPIPLLVAYLLLSLVGYGLLLLVFRATLNFNWRVVALIFLACWIILDLSWQNRLLHQLVDTYRTFSGKNTQEKLAVGPDATLYDFVSQVMPLLEPGDTRIFVLGNDKYSGQRAAYYLYPFNVYWPEPGRVLPQQDFFRRGDYVVLIRPTTAVFDGRRNKLWLPDTGTFDAQLVVANPVGTAVRLN
jgi:hypothetical protein